mgnify:CR=1 FL=1
MNLLLVQTFAQAPAIVLDQDFELLLPALQGQARPPGLRVAADVGQRLLHDVKDLHFLLHRQALIGLLTGPI